MAKKGKKKKDNADIWKMYSKRSESGSVIWLFDALSDIVGNRTVVFLSLFFFALSGLPSLFASLFLGESVSVAVFGVLAVSVFEYTLSFVLLVFMAALFIENRKSPRKAIETSLSALSRMRECGPEIVKTGFLFAVLRYFAHYFFHHAVIMAAFSAGVIVESEIPPTYVLIVLSAANEVLIALALTFLALMPQIILFEKERDIKNIFKSSFAYVKSEYLKVACITVPAALFVIAVNSLRFVVAWELDIAFRTEATVISMLLGSFALSIRSSLIAGSMNSAYFRNKAR